VSDDERDQLVRELERHAAQLSETFDSVQIICTKDMADGTGSYRAGTGNWYARVASCEEFILHSRQRMCPPDGD
jgi:hypothetical protein